MLEADDDISAVEDSYSIKKSTPKNLKKTTRIPNLQDLEKVDSEGTDSENTILDEEELATNGTEAFSEEALKVAWDQFKDERKLLGNDKEVNILNQAFDINGTRILLKLTNPIQVDMLEDFKSDLLNYLRKSLNNYEISLTAKVLEGDEKKMIYTNKEKFNHLAEKNPALKSLAEKLGLDPDI